MRQASAMAFGDSAEALLGPPVMAPRERANSLTWLEAHAAVRLCTLTGKSFDCYGLPLRQSHKDRRARFSLIKSVKGLASHLTTRINPSFQECLIRVVESESDLTFEVRQLSGGNCARGQLLFAAPLTTLLDVVSDSVTERDTVIFAHLPSSFQPAAENSSYVAPVDASTNRRAPRTANTPRTTVPRKKIVSTLFSAYGDIGLDLVFRAAQADAVNLRRSSSSLSSVSHSAAASGSGAPYTRVRLRFVSTKERNAWLSFCAEAYLGLLLDSIRTDRDTVFVVDENDHPSLTAAASPSTTAVPRGDVLEIEKPTEEAVGCYIDFFLSVSAKGNTGGGSNGDATLLPCPRAGS
ncbi:hypothetical protein LSCM4_04063 [Leishmania orientalis]|uniref:Uncharacterized protein n=1 Tax=Leishmania orientalis TaxID=2249476 RepID=A0A836GJI4_9TRYP|nr:hypothetical protein LSCM4_04063 [Leishmania orientalis]